MSDGKLVTYEAWASHGLAVRVPVAFYFDAVPTAWDNIWNVMSHVIATVPAELSKEERSE